FATKLEYYEPELHIIEQSAEQTRSIFRDVISPVVLRIAESQTNTTVAGTIPPKKLPSSFSNNDEYGHRIVETYTRYGVRVAVVGFQNAPQLVRYHLRLEQGTRFEQVVRQSTNLQIALALENEPVISAGPGFVCFDVQKVRPDPVKWEDVVNHPDLRNKSPVAIPIGIDVSNKPIIADLADSNTTHVLVAGTSGSGKSEFLKSLIATLVNRNQPGNLILTLIDPKRVTFGASGPSTYLSHPIIFNIEEALQTLITAADDVDRRYDILLQEGLIKLSDRFERGRTDIPYHVLIFDEFADLINAGRKERREFEQVVARVAAKGRAAGVHLVVATQRPDREIVTGQLKANLPLRICFKVTNGVNSKIVLDETGAENLLGRGDLMCVRGKGIERAQGPFISQEDFTRLVGRA
ncbi:MAG: DUF87 domain-containing protein, partial [Verrucomicrobia bacterium]|nr:DUF87 domain-containing protein [Verrucomicrobiota bacterium]